MAGNMIMPNDLSAYKQKMSGAELKKTVRNFVEGYQGASCIIKNVDVEN